MTSVDESKLDQWKAAQARRGIERELELPLKGGGGDGTSGGMEARIASLEAHMVHVSKAVDKLGDVPERLVALETKVDALPTKDYLSEQFGKYLTRTGIVVAIITSIVAAVARLIGS